MNQPIVVEHLTRSYGKRRGVIDLSFEVLPGEVFGFLGPNGAGKSTTIRLLMGLIRPDEGSATIFGHDCWNESPLVKAEVGFLPGEIHLPDNLSGGEMLDFFGAFRNVDRQRLKRLVHRSMFSAYDVQSALSDAAINWAGSLVLVLLGAASVGGALWHFQRRDAVV